MSRTRSPRLAADLSPEVEWYLETRGYDLESHPARPLIRTMEPRNVKGAEFHPDRVDRVVAALGKLKHTKGKWAGQPIVPTAVQVAFIIAPVFGWVHRDTAGDWVRIIRRVYVEMPRKGAKTTLVSGLAMVLGFADDEPGAEVILGAASREQAGQAYKPLEGLARTSRVLADAGVKATKREIFRASDGSVVKAVSSRGDLAHGANVHGGLIDELHVHKSPDLLEAIESGTGARRQPLVFIITTADDGKTDSVYAERRHYIEQLASGALPPAQGMYGVIFAADRAEDPFAESTWERCNPLYPATPSPEFMRGEAEQAKSSAAALASFLRLHLGIRSDKASRYIDMDRWARNASMVVESDLAGRRCYGGLDLASVSDLTACVWLFPDDDRGGYDVLSRFWLPEAAVAKLDAKTHRAASGWVKNGLISLTPGDVTDYDFIRAQILRDAGTFDVQLIGYDRWNASQLVIDLAEKDDLEMVKVAQGTVTLNAPLREMERLVLSGTAEKPLFRHGGNPVARWMVDNLRVYTDSGGNIKPDKKTSMDKVDFVSAAVTGLAVAMGAEKDKESIWDRREPLVL